MRMMTLLLLSGLAAAPYGCGKDKNDSSDVPPSAGPAQKGEKVFTLQSGNYLLSNISDLDDGCGKKPTDPTNPITAVPFALTNDSQGNVTLEFCSGGQAGVAGTIKGNNGTLTVQHPGRRIGNSDIAAVFDQECTTTLALTGDNTLKLHYVEKQTNRNRTLREATTDVAECTTSFDAVMAKQPST